MGLRRGIVSDIEEATRSIRKAVEEASRVAGVTPDSLYVGIAGEHVRAMCSTGVVAISGHEIMRTDVDRVNEVARAMAIPQDRELLHAIPQEYRVDKTDGIRDPVGMIGTRLETEMYLVTIGSSPAMNLRKSIERAGYKTRELVLEPLASALAVLTEEEKELGVILLELGAGTTDLAVFHEGKIRHLGTIPYGGNAVTSDLVQGLGITNSDAEQLKEAYGCAYEPMVDAEQVIAMPASASHAERHISRELMSHIIHQRMDECRHRPHRWWCRARRRERTRRRRVRPWGARWHTGRQRRRTRRADRRAALFHGGWSCAVRRAPRGVRWGDRAPAVAHGRRRRQAGRPRENVVAGLVLTQRRRWE